MRVRAGPDSVSHRGCWGKSLIADADLSSSNESTAQASRLTAMAMMEGVTAKNEIHRLGVLARVRQTPL